MGRARSLTVWMLLVLVIGGCSSTPIGGDPTVTMLDSEVSVRDRVSAIRMAWDDVDATLLDAEVARNATKRLIWGGFAERIRVSAIDGLLRDDRPGMLDDTRRLLTLRLPTDPDWGVISHIGEIAAARGWTDLTPGLIRSYARPVEQPADIDRPERRAIESLHPGRTVTDVAFEVFLTPAEVFEQPEPLGQKVRQDAWALLSRLDPTGRERARLLGEVDVSASDDPMVRSIRTAWETFGVVPLTRSELEWLELLDDTGPDREWWTDTAGAIASLGPDQRAGLRMRHLEPIRLASSLRSEYLGISADGLLQRLDERLAGRTHRARDTQRMGLETLDAWRGRMVWGDAVTILMLDDSLRDEAIRSALFAQVASDRIDPTTEYGGVLGWREDGWEARLYRPRATQRKDDRTFIAPAPMFQESARSTAHYHFHANEVRNWKYAGPGTQDMGYARTHGRACIVFTSIDEDTLNADYFDDNGVIIDLGMVRRP